MLEHDIDAFLLGDLARLALEAILAVVDDVIRAERLHALDLLIAADSGDDGATDGFGHHDGHSADAGAARVHEYGFARLQLGVVEQHVLNGREGDGCAGGGAGISTTVNWRSATRVSARMGRRPGNKSASGRQEVSPLGEAASTGQKDFIRQRLKQARGSGSARRSGCRNRTNSTSPP